MACGVSHRCRTLHSLVHLCFVLCSLLTLWPSPELRKKGHIGGAIGAVPWECGVHLLAVV